MNTFAAIEVSRSADYKLALLSLLIAYFVLYPLGLVYKRWRFRRRITQNTATSMYRLPVALSPVELSYVFSSRIKKRHIQGTVLDLLNRDALAVQDGVRPFHFMLGSKPKQKLTSFEKLLVGQIHLAGMPVSTENISVGFTSYTLTSGEKIQGNRNYVFWWLVRNTLRYEKRIYRSMASRYASLLLRTAIMWSAVVVAVPLFTVRILQAIDSGDVVVANLVEHVINAFLLWLLCLMPLIVMSVLLLKLRGLMLGREWIMQPQFLRYLEQFDSFRAFVYLTHSNKLRFESEELRRESIDKTMPYAIALGYVKWDES